MAKIETLHELFVDTLKDLYSAETQITQALPQMAQAAKSPDLRAGFEMHLRQTQEQINRLDQILSELGESPQGKHCKGMEGLIAEGQELMREAKKPSDVLDAGLIAAAQKVEHYEIAGYGTARVHAQIMGHDNALRLLEQTLNEEKQTDQKLTQLAEGHINMDAASKGM